MNDVKTLIELDWKSLIPAIFAIIAGFLAIRKIIIEFCNAIGYVPVWRREREEMKKVMNVITEEVHQIKKDRESDQLEALDYQKKMSQQQDEMMDALRELKNDIVQNNIDRMRYEILEFGNSCRSRDYSKESYDHVLETYDKYNEILKENGLENGRVDAAMAFIKDKYDGYLRDGFPF